jgi:hypothetical protein
MRIVTGALLLLALCVPMARADPLADEIAHLIDFIRTSSCTFIRNGSDYTGSEAADHVQAKYEHFKDEIHTVEDFIDRAASRSLMSGKAYEVRCADKTMPAADWIRTEDEAYRARQK